VSADLRVACVLLIAWATCGCPSGSSPCTVRGSEVCNGVDDDCNGLTDDGVPISAETCNGEDDDCDGAIDEGVFGIRAGPWLIAENFGSPSWLTAGQRDDGGVVLVWGRWADVDELAQRFRASYAVLSPTGERLVLADVPVALVEGAEVVSADGRTLLLVSERGNLDLAPKPHRLLMYVVAADGTLGEPVPVWDPPDAEFAFVTDAVVHEGSIVAGLALADFGDHAHFGHLVLVRFAPDGRLLDVWPSNPPDWTSDRGRDGRFTPTAGGGWRAIWDAPESRRQNVMYPGSGTTPLRGPIYSVDWANLDLPSSIAEAASLTPGGLLLHNSTSQGPVSSGDRLLSPYVVYLADGNTVSDAGFIAIERTDATFGLPDFVHLPLRVSEHSWPATTSLNPDTYVFADTRVGGPDQPVRVVAWHARDATRFVAALDEPPVAIDIPGLRNSRVYVDLFGASSFGGDRAFVVYRVVPLEADGQPTDVVERMYGAVLGCL
jgi:hypothetical protein